MTEPKTSDKKNEDRSDGFSGPFKQSFRVGFALIAVYASVSIAITIWGASRVTTAVPWESIAFAARLIQVSLGMMIGFFTIFLGMLAAWMGVEGRFRVAGEGQNYSLTLASASPGILLILCGTMLVSMCLLDHVDFKFPIDEKVREFIRDELQLRNELASDSGASHGRKVPRAPSNTVPTAPNIDRSNESTSDGDSTHGRKVPPLPSNAVPNAPNADGSK